MENTKMGMILSLYSIDAQHAGTLRAQPALAWKVIVPDDPEWADQMIASAGVPADQAAQFQLTEGDVAETDLDKAWHAIHYLLTGSVWEGEAPLDFLLQGGTVLGDEDEESEPMPRLFDRDAVQAINAALSQVDADTLRARYDPARMQALDIYPGFWDRGDEELDYCLQYYAELQNFVAEAALQQRALLIVIG
jgi:hypothetical protein